MPVPVTLTQHLAVWLANGMVERPDWESRWRAPCEDRRPSGMCGRIECLDKAKVVACKWLVMMSTADCPAGKFAAIRQAERAAG